MLLLLAFQTRNGWRRWLTPRPVQFLIIVQVIIFLKTIAYGSISFALLAALSFAAVVLMVRLGPSRWLQDEQNFYWATWSIAVVGIIFILANVYQAIFDVHAITFVNGWFSGTTGNPQHAAVLVVTTLPCFIFLIESCKQWNWKKNLWIIGFISITIALFFTASRTGVLMFSVLFLFFYRHKIGGLLKLGLICGIALVVFLPLLNQDAGLGISYTTAINKLLSGDNTRAGVWSALWRAFINNPFFGAPLKGDRLGYGESSWLAAAATLGLVGLFPLMLFGLDCFRMINKLIQTAKKQPRYALHCNTVIAGLATLLAGSFSEAFLLGNLTFPLIALLMYLSMGSCLLEANARVQRQLYESQYSDDLSIVKP
ncbi:O-antigen ligase family protein [Gloeocapsopsis dulcis]|uniref:O-antigen ligase family protein n=1 Tax=Gloeocapsopsis dulcis TaxID=2859516 RepID=UPI00101ADB3D|nr:O-antigen ligase family protein [Gloeocapsopsis dulcis]WNN91094.1 O-antigen ligase family protein [Gloeocapsopsis dulcis]